MGCCLRRMTHRRALQVPILAAIAATSVFALWVGARAAGASTTGLDLSQRPAAIGIISLALLGMVVYASVLIAGWLRRAPLESRSLARRELVQVQLGLLVVTTVLSMLTLPLQALIVGWFFASPPILTPVERAFVGIETLVAGGWLAFVASRYRSA